MTDRARVLVVTDEMEVGGSQRQLVHLLTALDRTRWQPELVYFRERSFLVDQLEAANVPVTCIAKRSRVDPSFVTRLASHLRRGRYDVVQCYSLTAEMWVRAVLPFASRTTFVAAIRGLFHVYSTTQWRIKRWIMRRCDLAIANTAAGARETASRTGFPLEKIAVIPNGVALPPLADVDVENARAALELPRGRTIVLFVGRLVIEKNLAMLLDALAAIEPMRRPFVMLAGHGELDATLRAQATSLGLDADVRWLGERRDTMTLMRLADLLVLPSTEEGLSNVLLEAMAVGCPVLASDVGGNVELIDDDRTGMLFPSGRRDALIAALTRLCDDATLRRRLGEAARREIQTRYSIPSMVAATEAAWRRAMERAA